MQDIPGCYCIQGFVRNAEGICVQQSEYKSKFWFFNIKSDYSAECATNEVFKQYVSYSDYVCTDCKENRGPVSGCMCPDGYLRNVTSKECIKKENCPLNLSKRLQ